MKTRLPMTILAVAASALLLSGCSVINSLTGGETRDDDGTIIEGGDTDVFSLTVGDCIGSAAAGDGEVSSVATVPCDEPHDDEVYFDFELAGDDYPGEDAIFTEANQGCSEAFAEFVGIAYDDSQLEFTYYYPTVESWGSGDRLITCIIYDPAGQTTGSLAGSGR